MDLKGKTCLVTGSARRLGRAVALELARAGCRLALHHHRSLAEARSLSAEVRALGAECRLFKADLSTPQGPKALARSVLKAWGSCELLVNSAAIFPQGPFTQAGLEDFEGPWRINLRAPALLTQAIGGHNHQRRIASRIVNLGDVGGQLAWPGALPYSLSKAGLNQLTRASARALAPWVLVNCLAFGPMLPTEGAKGPALRRSLERTALKRLGGAQEAARAVRFLFESDFITGAILPVDGGRSLVG